MSTGPVKRRSQLNTKNSTSGQLDPEEVPSFGEVSRYWVKLGFISFGGPAGQIAMMQTECVDKRNWIGQGEFLRGLNYAMLLPGPEAQQLAAYIGWRLHGVRGALFAGISFIIPGTILMMLLAWIVVTQSESSLVQAIFSGVKPVVVAIIIHALWRIGAKACNTVLSISLAIAAFAAIKFGSVPFPIVILSSGILGSILAQCSWGQFTDSNHDGSMVGHSDVSFKTSDILARWVIVTFWVLLIGALPCIFLIVGFGSEPFLDIVKLFTSAAFVTFGGAYAVLPYIADASVAAYDWLTPAEMINGLALAESTPGPLILVTTYVGFFAGWKTAGLTFAFLAAGLTTLVTFLPSFLFIIAGSPYVEVVQKRAWARNSLGAITAAVVGVIFNLAVFFGEAALIFDGQVIWINFVTTVFAFTLLFSGRCSVPMIVGIGAVLGVILDAVV